MQAVFLPVILAIWAVCWLRSRAVPWLLLVGAIAAAVFLIGWPHLWSNPLEQGWRYFTRSTDRISLLVWFEGRPIPDRQVPWHYPWVVFAVSVPLGLQFLGCLGGLHSLRSPRTAPAETLLLLGTCVPLVIFSLPGVPVYDGERLFSVVYPPWAVLIGKGAQVAYDWCLARRPELARPRWQIACLLLLASTQCVGLFRTAPCWLQYYNLACGGLPGAVRLGLSPGYWGDGLTRQLLQDVARVVPPGSTV
ncbi:MAG: 4-amino-4-deoxy-L-arabinose transferase, partial [Planctomycetaceae bacterium]